MAFIDREKITVFPVANKPTDPLSRLNTEYNLTNIVNRLVDTRNFVITNNEELQGQHQPFEFNINGYYVKVKGPETELDTNGMKIIVDSVYPTANYTKGANIYACIFYGYNVNSHIDKPHEPLTFPNFQELVGLEEDSVYTGVQFGATDTFTKPINIEGIDNNMVVFKILSYDGTKWYIPRNSKIRFNQFALDTVDDGDLDNPTTIYNIN